MCNAPLDFAVIMSSEKIKAFYTYCEFKPMKFLANTSFKKIIGLNQRRLCFNCYSHVYLHMIPGPRELLKRETTIKPTRMMHYTHPPTLTLEMVYEWFKGFNEFCARPDLEEYLLKTKKFKASGLVVIGWLHDEPYLPTGRY